MIVLINALILGNVWIEEMVVFWKNKCKQLTYGKALLYRDR